MTQKIHEYFIEPLAPLVFRSAKPFGSQAFASDANYPLPSSAAGLLRAQYLNDQLKQKSTDFTLEKQSNIDEDTAKNLRTINVSGVFLLQYDEDKPELLIPKPQDAIYTYDENDNIVVSRLRPKNFNEDCGANLPNGLSPLQINIPHRGKSPKTPNYWRWQDFTRWRAGESLSYKDLKDNGLSDIPVDIRTHTAVSDITYAAEPDMIFQTAGLDLGVQRRQNQHGWQNKRLFLLITSEQSIPDRLVRFGGESRLSRITKNTSETILPTCNEKSLEKSKHICLTLLTPAIFTHGWRPAWIDEQTLEGIIPHTDTKVRLISVACDGWIPVSGWDLQSRCPKAMRKAVTAGSVYWFEIIDNTQNNLHKAWLKSVSDDEQDQRDGFGIACIHACTINLQNSQS